MHVMHVGGVLCCFQTFYHIHSINVGPSRLDKGGELPSLAVESKKRVQRRKNWYSNDIGIKICEMFHTITYTKST